MVASDATYNAWPAVRARIVALEHDAFSWGDTLRQYRGEGDPQKIHHAEYAMEIAERELNELRNLLSFWEARTTQSQKIALPLQAGIIAVTLYCTFILAILLYLIAR
jgi:hypothetical protein